MLRDYSVLPRQAHATGAGAEFQTKITQQDISEERPPSCSFDFLMPATDVSARMRLVAKGLPGICSPSRDTTPSDAEDACPLIWNRGPKWVESVRRASTNPVYALVVRKQFATATFGSEVCRKWLRPCFYWNGLSSGDSREYRFWKSRDPLRVARKEESPAEAYVPVKAFTPYCLIMVGGAGARRLASEADAAAQSVSTDEVPREPDLRYAAGVQALKAYLEEARRELQPWLKDGPLAFTSDQKCG
ncbi:MAG: hypothetical protein BJ554DRAFT_636 [Olpidium bornovanus]|uniref:Uncharacterized protein n=1 Tax=Olpidium bornovanus TaxID=278681 RepID=A0A8H8A1K1_9FUNG|nr:MAG: hypothetical protein BJ554DRAFT_636 [Olpidium bornovanus]